MNGAGPPLVIDAARTAAELQAKLAGLTSELCAWREASSREDSPLWRHHTQIQAVAGTLQEAAADLAGKFTDAGPGLWILDQAGALDRQIMDLHRLWGFFRAKFALRYVPWLAAPLIASDDLAWACYSPAQEYIAPERRREPPLLYFTGGTSPFLLPRGTPYVVESLPDGSLREPEFTEAVRLIPVALIGLPWFQVDHLPDAPLIGHEAGHAVEQDLGLADVVRDRIKAAVCPERQAGWASWSSEIFADIYGTLCCGSGFARALTALLATHPREVAGEEPGPGNWGSYPTRTLRVLLTAAVLARLDVQLADPSVADAWLATYAERSLADYEPDVDAVAAAVLDGPYDALDSNGLTAIMRYTTGDEAKVSRLAGQLLAGVALDAGGGVRHVMAAARLAYDRDRTAYATGNAARFARAKIASFPHEGVRAFVEAALSPGERKDLRERRDHTAGSALSGLLGRAAQRDDDQEAADVPT
jgi:hypothetical protein